MIKRGAFYTFCIPAGLLGFVDFAVEEVLCALEFQLKYFNGQLCRCSKWYKMVCEGMFGSFALFH